MSISVISADGRTAAGKSAVNNSAVQAAADIAETAKPAGTNGPAGTATPASSVTPGATSSAVTGPTVTASPIPSGSAVTPEQTEDPNELTEIEKKKADYFTKHSVEELRTKKDIEKRVVIKWKKQFGADTYTIYRSTEKKGEYKLLGDAKRAKFIDRNADCRQTYFYVIQAQMTIRGKDFFNKKCKPLKVYVRPKNPLTVIAGECFVVDMEAMKSVFKSNHRFVAKIGVNTYTMQHSNYFTYNGQMITGIERIAYYNPDRVYFVIGANESAWTTTSYTMGNYKQMRSLLKKINKHVEIVLVKIPPFGRTSSQNIPSVSQRDKFNLAYMEFADSYEDVYFCPATNVLSDNSSHLLSQYDGGDGCHWNESGTVAVVNAMKEWSKKVFHNW